MPYRTMLALIMGQDDLVALDAYMLPFAKTQGAKLDVLCLAVDTSQTGYYFAGATALVHDEERRMAGRQISQPAGANRGVSGSWPNRLRCASSCSVARMLRRQTQRRRNSLCAQIPSNE